MYNLNIFTWCVLAMVLSKKDLIQFFLFKQYSIAHTMLFKQPCVVMCISRGGKSKGVVHKKVLGY